MDINRCAQAQFANITNIGLGHNELKIGRGRRTKLRAAPDFDTGKIGYPLVGQEINVIKLVQPIPFDDAFPSLNPSQVSSPRSLSSLQRRADTHPGSIPQRHQLCLPIRADSSLLGIDPHRASSLATQIRHSSNDIHLDESDGIRDELEVEGSSRMTSLGCGGAGPNSSLRLPGERGTRLSSTKLSPNSALVFFNPGANRAKILLAIPKYRAFVSSALNWMNQTDTDPLCALSRELKSSPNSSPRNSGRDRHEDVVLEVRRWLRRAKATKPKSI